MAALTAFLLAVPLAVPLAVDGAAAGLSASERDQVRNSGKVDPAVIDASPFKVKDEDE